MIDDLFEFLQEGVTPYHAAATAAPGWTRRASPVWRRPTTGTWNRARGYYLLRNGSAVVAWRIPAHAIGGWAHHGQPQRRPGLEDQVRRRDE